MRLREIARLLAAAVLLASMSTPALAQTADLGVALALVGDDEPADAGFTLGGVETYEVTVTSAVGATHVTEFTLGATLGAGLELVAAPAGCEPVDTVDPIDDFPCVVTLDPPLLSGEERTLTIDVSYALPPDADPVKAGRQLPTAASACPNGAVTATSSVTVSNLKQGTTAVTDPTANSASVAATLRNWTDLEVVSVEGPANVSEGQTVTYTAQVKNNGPCPAPNVRVTLGPAGSLTYVEGSVSASCDNGDAGFAPRNRCELGTLAKDEVATVSADYTVQGFAREVTAAAVPVDVSIASRTVTTPALSLGADDPAEDNNSDDTSAPIDLSDNEGCSTGGAGTLVGGLLALAALRLRRRR